MPYVTHILHIFHYAYCKYIYNQPTLPPTLSAKMEPNKNDIHQAYSKTCMLNKTSKLLNINNKMEQNNVVREINFH